MSYSTPEKKREYARRWYAENHDHVRELANTWRSINIERARECQRKSYHKHKDRYRGERLQELYGITSAEFQDMLMLQGGRCAICGGQAKLHVDHDHETGTVRGLLCYRCNLMIGQAGDDPELLDYAASYLRGA